MNNRSIAICYGQYTRSEDKEHHCWVNNRCPGWGCRKLNAIGPQNSCPASAFKFWYSFGKFTNKKMKFWKIDKEELLKQLEREIKRFEVTECPAFNIDKAKAMIASFPDTIHIDGNKYVLLEDSKTGKVLGISHWDDPDDYLNMDDYDIKWQD